MVYRIGVSLLALLAAGGCSDRNSTGPAGSTALSGSAASARGDGGENSRSGVLHLEKECSVYTGLAGSYCTITRSNLKEIPVGTREFALKDADLVGGTLNSDGVLYVRDGELALNHCDIFDIFATEGVIGNCTFSGGIGHLSGFHGKVVVSAHGLEAWFDGTYSFSKGGD